MSATITGFVYSLDGTGRLTEVTGYPISQSMTGYTFATVSVLTDDGAIVDHVRVPTEVLGTVRVCDLVGMSERMVWRIAERDLFGRGGHALAELARRERLARQQWKMSVTAGRRAGVA